ncbi:MAG: AAA family ATPase [Prevotella sp.]|nr:AAA family ATPase [Staphylococcus sp.]MCM1349915.1 AAA family ATPase [Prevotella sp.]
MKKITIKNLTLQNFKGIKKRTFDFANQSVNFYGDNATGKTTIVDAFLWLLFNKNSNGASDFSIKPIDANGNVLHNVDYSVSAVFTVDDGLLTYDVELKKVLREKYTKKRGETQSTFTGHETSYFKDGAPKLLKEYQQEVDKLCSEDTFKMLTAPFYFNKMDKKTKREVLLKAIPDVSNLDVVEKNSSLYPLLEELKVLSIEELTAKYKAAASTANKQIPSYGYKIEELQSMINTETEEDDISGLEDVKTLIQAQKDYILELQEQRNTKTNLAILKAIDGEILALEEKLHQAKLVKMENDGAKLKELQEEVQNLSTTLQFKKGEKLAIGVKKVDTETLISRQEERILDLDKLIETAYQRCAEIDGAVFNGETVCPTCGQALPQEQVEHAKEMFNLDKANKLQKAIENGKQLKVEYGNIQNELNNSKLSLRSYEIEAINMQSKISEMQQELTIAEERLEQAKNQCLKSTTDEIIHLQYQIAAKREEKQQLMSESSSAGDIALTIMQESKKLDDYYGRKSRYESNIANRKRINELQQEQKQLSNEYNQAIVKVNLCESFLKEKVKLIEQDVNKLFTKVNFTMFREQINGGYEEVCYATIDGVPFDDANNAAKINAGLDIIKTLQKVEGTIAPIFIDNAESVTKFDELENTQLIKLYVKENEKELQMEVK